MLVLVMSSAFGELQFISINTTAPSNKVNFYNGFTIANIVLLGLCMALYLIKWVYVFINSEELYSSQYMPQDYDDSQDNEYIEEKEQITNETKTKTSKKANDDSQDIDTQIEKTNSDTKKATTSKTDTTATKAKQTSIKTELENTDTVEKSSKAKSISKPKTQSQESTYNKTKKIAEAKENLNRRMDEIKTKLNAQKGTNTPKSSTKSLDTKSTNNKK